MAIERLPLDWAWTPTLDEEIKRYTLLGYLQHVRARFQQRKLYPHLGELKAHVNGLFEVQRRKDELQRAFPGKLRGFDPSTGALLREAPVDPDELALVDDVVAWALTEMRKALDDGQGLRDDIGAHIQFEPVGLVPLEMSAGWLLLRGGNDVRAYRYTVPLFRTPDAADGLAHVRTSYTASFTYGLACSYEHIKAELIRVDRSMPNPAVFAFTADVELPRIETFMPMAKQLVYEVVGVKR